jgi:hypothetical protein
MYITQLAAFVTINVTTKVGMRFMQRKPNTYTSTGHHSSNTCICRCDINYNRCCPLEGKATAPTVYCNERKHVTLIRFVIYHLYSLNLQLLIDEEQTILRKNTLFLSGSIETTDEIPNDTRKEVNFLLCPSCFWCASCLSPDSTFTKCPSCIESLPIAENEDYRLDNDIKSGITVEFLPRV